MTNEDPRAALMLDWLSNDLSLAIDRFEPASSDASFRRYFRIYSQGTTYIVMDAPPDKENIEAFIKVAKLLSVPGIHVPTIFQSNLAHGFLLLEDFGKTCYLDCLKPSNADYLYQYALDSLFQQQTLIALDNLEIPHYDRPLLIRELGIFEEWFTSHFLNTTIPETLRIEVNELLINSALEQPLTFVHRDYHSRNLMNLGNGKSGIIDFQDAVIGPVTYDLVSLLKDCYISWPKAQIDHWRNGYFQRLLQHGIIDCSQAQFKRWFDLMGLQRHLKAIGIFARLHLRDGKSAYLNDIPRTINYVTETSTHYPELSEFADFLNRQVLPAFRSKT
ncbi:aminoglycoside phosphotransferase family protein [Methylotuvimicrobium buryatense]|uniref:Aminoglycoside phosphotransferase n=1 Tax=Methylotuvimicrobium buryatense TaxID=95641 RepID=A0A4P9UTT6_METBY|nr:phosphotransferase [Methylotuvimicrobium buryatense]QCW84040.1 aminoglycoside phosphotransferase [Methylotuvimicrobium buryatense]